MPAQSSRGDEIEGLIARAWALSAQGRFSEALAPLDRALALAPDNPNAWTLKGGALVGLKRHQEALVCLEKALAQRKEDPLAWTYEGQALYDLGRFSEAATCFKRAIALDPSQFSAKAGLIWSTQKVATATAVPGPSGALPTVSTLVLDEVTPGSLTEWKERYDPKSMNPQFGCEEFTSPFDRSTALRTWAKGSTFATCETKWIRRVYATGPQQTDGAVVEAFLAFAFDGTAYNLPSVRLELLDERGQVVASQVYFGKGIIGSFNRGQLPKTGYRELPSASGLQHFDLVREFGSGRRFSALAVSLMNYACQGENSVVFDHFVLRPGQR
jgi:tetratricopeptide (TPR) repeat protein